MPYVTVPRDISKVKNKIAMGLTKRQLLCVAAAGIVAIPLYLLTMKPLGQLALYLAVIPAVPFFLLGFYRAPDGRPLEKVLGNYIRVRYKCPQVRPYQINNIYAKLAMMQKIQEVIEHAATEQIPDNEDKKAGSLRKATRRHKKKSPTAG